MYDTPIITNATRARADIYNLIERVHDEGRPAFITGKKHNAVLISEEEWRGMMETIYLSSIPGMKESILAARASPRSEDLAYTGQSADELEAYLSQTSD
jgi:PHD/YefM family antitoxin component YafN of YafNO toxin-antitoxin module